MQDANDKGKVPVEHRKTEPADSDSLIRLLRAYMNKHPESAVVFGITTSGGKRAIQRGGKAGLRGPMAMELQREALLECIDEQRKNGPRVVPASLEVSPETAKAFLDAVRGRQGG